MKFFMPALQDYGSIAALLSPLWDISKSAGGMLRKEGGACGAHARSGL